MTQTADGSIQVIHYPFNYMTQDFAEAGEPIDETFATVEAAEQWIADHQDYEAKYAVAE